MIKMIMRSLGYVPQAVLTDVHNECVRAETDLAANKQELKRLYAKIEDDNRHHLLTIGLKNATIDDLQAACRNLEKRAVSSRLISVYVVENKSGKGRAYDLVIAGYDKDGMMASACVRSLVANAKNRKTLAHAADVLALVFGISNTTVPESLQPSK